MALVVLVLLTPIPIENHQALINIVVLIKVLPVRHVHIIQNQASHLVLNMFVVQSCLVVVISHLLLKEQLNMLKYQLPTIIMSFMIGLLLLAYGASK